MNYIEKLVDRKLRRLSWKCLTLDRFFTAKKVESMVSQYRWIIKDSDEQIIYDTKVNGYEGLSDFPAVIDALNLITSAEKQKVNRKKLVDKPEIVFTLDPRLWSIFPYEQLEQMCIQCH